jgi:hypothetical protein
MGIASLHPYTYSLFLFKWMSGSRLKGGFGIEAQALLDAIQKDVWFYIKTTSRNVECPHYFRTQN